MDQLQQVQHWLQLLLAKVAESESGTFTGKVGPVPMQVAVEREDHPTAFLGIQAIDQIDDRRPHSRREIRHGELCHSANLPAAFAGKPARGPSSGLEPSTTADGFDFTRKRGIQARWPSRPGQNGLLSQGGASRPHPGLSSTHTEGFNRRLRLPAT